MGAYKLQSGSTMIGAGLNLLTNFSIAPGNQNFNGHSIPGSGAPVDVGATDQFGRFGQRSLVGIGNAVVGGLGARALINLLRNPIAPRRQLLAEIFGRSG